MNVVPYTSFNIERLPMPAQMTPLPGQSQIVHFTVDSDIEAFTMLLDKIRLWFAENDEVLLVDHGTTAQGLGFVVLEWEGFAVNPLFLSILTHEDIVDDFSVYTRDRED